VQYRGAIVPPTRYIIALPATDTEDIKQRLDALVASTSSHSVLMPSNIIALLAADAKVVKQLLDALVAAAKAVEEKAAAVRHRILAVRQLHDKEQAAAAKLEWYVTTKRLVPGSMSSSTTETVTTSPSYVVTIVANFHILADTMMEEIHLDTFGPATAPTAFYSNKMSPPLAPPRPPGKNNSSGPDNSNSSNNNQNSNNNRRNGDSGGKNSNTIGPGTKHNTE
jgi:hypothetical protein